jgi:glycosyltransferase involved in cell wall biosynthesis
MKKQCVLLNFNTLRVMRRSIEALRQDRVEVIVVDNASDDGSIDFLRSCPDLRVIVNSSNLGSSVGRNQGISLADPASDLLLLDGDVLYVPTSYEFLRKIQEASSSDNVGFDHDAATPLISDLWDDPLFRRAITKSGTMVYTHYGLFRAGLFDIIRFDEDYGVGWGFEDLDLYLQMIHLGMRMTAVQWRYYHARKSSIVNLALRNCSIRYAERQNCFIAKWRHTPEYHRVLLTEGMKRYSTSVLMDNTV